MTGIGFEHGRASPCIDYHSERSNSVCGCTVMTSYLDFSPPLHHQCRMFFCEAAGCLGGHKSRNLWASGAPRLCAKHSNAGQDCGMDCRWHHLGSRSSTCRAYQEVVRQTGNTECRDLARKMQQTLNLDETGLKRLARFLGVHQRSVWLFRWQKTIHTHRILV